MKPIWSTGFRVSMEFKPHPKSYNASQPQNIQRSVGWVSGWHITEPCSSNPNKDEGSLHEHRFCWGSTQAFSCGLPNVTHVSESLCWLWSPWRTGWRLTFQSPGGNSLASRSFAGQHHHCTHQTHQIPRSHHHLSEAMTQSSFETMSRNYPKVSAWRVCQ